MNSVTYNLPISVKGVVFEDGKIWLRKNERDEWELPGGKLEEGEQPMQTIIREVQEELGFEVKVLDLVHAYVYKIKDFKLILVISYLCELIKKTGSFEVIGEAGQAEFKLFSFNEIKTLKMPEFYKEAIKSAEFALKLHKFATNVTIK